MAFTVHYHGPADNSGKKSGDRVGGPYASKVRAQRVRDKKDNEHGSYVHKIKEHDDSAEKMEAKAALLNAERLAHKHADMHQVGEAAAKIEKKYGYGHNLDKLGLGKGYGE